ncbi:substrate-binding domain-containing protein [Anaerobium acetethylicum]|uniref:D-xylose transport system substrate-binding protein n=1 Tax=Anaerobium acetethylicum TaxID=1619234 RepID=A0A1D3TQF8_9FIRM|nr:substrate-binding domain-containing protein [Anaerobium acetethylicum]SCP95790.1 D-xylose transport system substrate-binding protein [Anaerobium acetethylicum]
MKRSRGNTVGILICILILCTTLGGCGPSETGRQASGGEAERKIRIGMSFDSLVIERWQKDRDAFVATAEELGADVEIAIANGSVEKQNAQIADFVKDKMDVIVIVPTDCEKISEAVRKAKDKGVKIISYDRLIRDAGVDLYISFDNEEIGRMMAGALIESVPENGSIAAVFGPDTDGNAAMVEKGFNEVIAEIGLKVIYKTYAEKWLAEKAFDAVVEALDTAGSFDGIVCGNDNLAGYAVKALSEHRLAGKVSVAGQDGDLDACQRIVEGTQTVTVYKPVEELAEKAARYAVMLAADGTIEADETIFDGKQAVPYEKLAPIAVTKENIEEVIIDGGVHLREDVYLNMPKGQ